jgi:hypothetical protein
MYFRRVLVSLIPAFLIAALLGAAFLVTDAGVPVAIAGGPRWVAGSSYFDPSTLVSL